ncbi:G-D-S-L family lipolytic protein [Flavobacterium sp. HXWNR29]|uniref:G-D-S-L family lipolytic protein n=1 Tax=Flavobacterium odoriferum TaxID=2946604 RepID=UPI0021CB22EB|nr:G-D-S-L family lipolytic protein [Flavobacterium sp. HXWNR29]MCU4189997.1 G-D-S-L family lipolytic protein [Flavobacterium sp. HXWNR29]
MKNKFIYLAIIAAGFASCEPEFENEVGANYTAGDADFTTYVAVGNSLTAGYMDGTVYKSGQANSFPNLLAQQFALVGGGTFTQPSFEEDVNNLGGFAGVPNSTRRIIDASTGTVENIAGTPTITTTSQATAYNNMGVPGAKSFHLGFPGYGTLNPYFARHATSPTATVIGDAMSKNPTFFTNWIGANDVLSYATNGGAQADGTTPAADHNLTGNMNPATYGSNDITNSGVFASVYSTLINTLTSGGAKGVVATVPSVTSIPYFTTVPYKPVPLDNTFATQLNSAYAAYNGGLDVAFSNGLITNAERLQRKVVFVAGKNPVVIVDSDLTNLSGLGLPSYRMTTSQDLIVLPASSFIGTTVGGDPLMINGVSVPLANKWVLTANEKAKVASATAAYNNTIVSIASANDLAVADMNSIMNQLVNGLQIETGQIYTANYFSGVATENKVLFSLDGVHPNARGYAVIANEIIKVINEHYNANLPLHYVNNFPGINIVGSN